MENDDDRPMWNPGLFRNDTMQSWIPSRPEDDIPMYLAKPPASTIAFSKWHDHDDDTPMVDPNQIDEDDIPMWLSQRHVPHRARPECQGGGPREAQPSFQDIVLQFIATQTKTTALIQTQLQEFQQNNEKAIQDLKNDVKRLSEMVTNRPPHVEHANSTTSDSSEQVNVIIPNVFAADLDNVLQVHTEETKAVEVSPEYPPRLQQTEQFTEVPSSIIPNALSSASLQTQTPFTLGEPGSFTNSSFLDINDLEKEPYSSSEIHGKINLLDDVMDFNLQELFFEETSHVFQFGDDMIANDVSLLEPMVLEECQKEENTLHSRETIASQSRSSTPQSVKHTSHEAERLEWNMVQPVELVRGNLLESGMYHYYHPHLISSVGRNLPTLCK